MSKRVGRICMMIGAVLITAALSLVLWNMRTDYKSKQTAQRILEQLKERIPQEAALQQESTVAAGNSVDLDHAMQPLPEQDLFAEYEAVSSESAKSEKVLICIEEDWYIGVITIPTLGVELPVLSEWSYPNLRKAPCRYMGDPITNDMIIAAHNYSSHFGNIRTLNSGDLVYFTNCEGTVYTYDVVQIDEIDGSNAAAMEEGDWDLTLFTCTYSGASRVTVRCKLHQSS